MNVFDGCRALCIASLLFGCTEKHDSGPFGGVGDDGGTCSANFRTVEIGTQIWMAENLNCDVVGSKCYDNDPSNCKKYGRLYDWAAAMTVCPSGWHLPSREDWNELSNYVEKESDCSKCDASKLKAANGWYNDGNGTDDYKFSALPGGYSNGNSDGTSSNGYWWSSSENRDDYAYLRDMYYSSESAGWFSRSKNYFFSVRCLKDSI